MYIEKHVLDALSNIARYTSTDLDTIIGYAFDHWSKLPPHERSVILAQYLNYKSHDKDNTTPWYRKIFHR